MGSGLGQEYTAVRLEGPKLSWSTLLVQDGLKSIAMPAVLHTLREQPGVYRCPPRSELVK